MNTGMTLKMEEPQIKRPRISSHEADVCIVGICRTPCGNLLGKLSSFSAVDLGAHVIREAVRRSGITLDTVEEVFMGNVLSANLGQAPARQAALKAGIPAHVPCTTVNKVCASGMKAAMLAAQSIMLGQCDVVVAGGMESMSGTPHYANIRKGCKFGELKVVDGIQKDGLNDAYENIAMGFYAEKCAEKYGITRENQDEFAFTSYQRSMNATKNGKFSEIAPVEILGKIPQIMTEDEEVVAREVSVESLSKLATVFLKEGGTVTAGNASPINDGAAAMVLVSRRKAQELGLKVIAVIRGFADAAKDPQWFTMAPSEAIPKALSQASLQLGEIDFFEINEAFSCVAIANTRALGLNPEKVNVYGGAVAIGHPLGCSGARIMATLCSVLRQEGGRFGCAAVCNGGGGASAIVLEVPEE